jgi:asparagine synthase (glutamine-hydrolysing)
MCGIAGAAWTTEGKPLAQADLLRMISVLEHRGPDDQGTYRSELAGAGCALGFRRLSIIDLAGGHQPLSNEDETVWIVFNGEVYNYRELRPQLESKGHRFRTVSDTETIVHLYEEYGVECLQQLRGMFALAIWDQRKQRLFLARDRMGKKPLVYRQTSRELFFASELKALLQVPGAPRELNPRSIDEFLLYQYVPHPHSILKGYSKLPPAHFAVFENGQLTVERYWRPPYEDSQAGNGKPIDAELDASLSSFEHAQVELRNRLTESVRLRMRSDVPLGAFLSGGIDSTIVAGLMQQLAQTPVHTFSIGFPVARFDERAYAREAAEQLGTRHHELVVEPQALEILPKLIWQYDEPFGDSSAIPTMYLSQMTREHVTVALSGDGGDELFAGYDRYQAVAIGSYFDRLPRPLQALLSAPIWQKIPASVEQKSRRRRLKRLLAELTNSPERRYLRWIGIFDDLRRGALYSDDFRATLAGADAAHFLLDAYRACPHRDFVTRTTCADVLTYLPCDILTKVDIASMAYSLECRCPFLDHPVVELAARLPIEWKRNGAQGKRILVETFSDLLPASIRKRKKMGFGVPLDHWFRNELKPLLYDALLDRRSLDRGYFREEAVRQLVDEHTSGGWDHSYRLWCLLVFEMWQRTYLDPVTAPERPAELLRV